MKEKILKKLIEQRGQNAQVSDKTLETMATSYALAITDDESLAKVDFKSVIESMQSNVNSVVKSEIEKQKPAGKTAAEIEAERVAKEKADAEKAALEKAGNEAPEWVKALTAKMDAQQQALSILQGEKITNSRTETLNKALENTSPVMKSQIINNFNRMKFDSDDDFDAYVESTKADVAAFNQEMSEKGVQFGVPEAGAQGGGEDVVSSEMKAVIKELTTTETKEEKPF